MKCIYLPDEHDERTHRLFVRNVAEGLVSFAPSKLLVLARGNGAFVDLWWGSDREFLTDITARQLLARGRANLESIPRDTE